MTTVISKIVKGACALALVSGVLAAQSQMPRTTTQKITGAATTSTETLRGTVEYVEGNTLVVKMANGDIRTFTPPESRRFIVDGKELTVRELQPGTKLNATVVTTRTAVTDRTTTVGTGKVWFVSGNNVILTLPSGENRQYKVKDDYRFIIDGNPKATVRDLRQGMTVRAEKIVEEPRVEIATDTRVTGTAPPPPVMAQAQPAPRAAPPRATPAPVAERLDPAPAPAPVAVPAETPAPALPKTASPLPLIGLLGLLCGGASLCLRKLC
jgi:hypothetical protein